MLKVRFETATIAAQASFAINQKLQAALPAQELIDATRKWWAAVERHLAVTLRRWNSMAAASAYV